jgi:tRNA(fMet)-specific endonuclease VapC
LKYLLDTDHISFLQRRSGSDFTTLATRIAQYPQSDFALSIVSFHEQVLGAHDFINHTRTSIEVIRGYALLSDILQGFSEAPVVQFDAKAIAVFDTLRSQRVRIATMDLSIAAIALSRKLVSLTRNTDDFG